MCEQRETERELWGVVRRRVRRGRCNRWLAEDAVLDGAVTAREQSSWKSERENSAADAGEVPMSRSPRGRRARKGNGSARVACQSTLCVVHELFSSSASWMKLLFDHDERAGVGFPLSQD